METTTQSVVQVIGLGAIAGLIAALVATAIVATARSLRQCRGRRRDVKYIRDVLINGRKEIMGAEQTCHRGMNVTISADTLRAACYNNMLRLIGAALERWTEASKLWWVIMLRHCWYATCCPSRCST